MVHIFRSVLADSLFAITTMKKSHDVYLEKKYEEFCSNWVGVLPEGQEWIRRASFFSGAKAGLKLARYGDMELCECQMTSFYLAGAVHRCVKCDKVIP